jgi:hypothetical protein
MAVNTIVNGDFATGDGTGWTITSSGGGSVQISDWGFGTGVTGNLSADVTIASGTARIQQNVEFDSNFKNISFDMVFMHMLAHTPGDYNFAKFSVFAGVAPATDKEIYSWQPLSDDVYITTKSTVTITKAAIESAIGASVDTVIYIALQVKFVLVG